MKEDGPDAALHDLDEGKLDAATAGLALDKWLEMMDEKKITVVHKADLKARVIGRDLIAVFVHPELKVSALSKEQLAKLFSGEVKSWKELGAADVAVKIVFGNKIPGTYKFFHDNVLETKNYPKDGMVQASDTADVMAKIKSTPGAIGLGPMASKDHGLVAPKIPDVGRPISFVTRGEPTPTLVKLISFIQNEGLKYTK